jgi:hypothetical protein
MESHRSEGKNFGANCPQREAMRTYLWIAATWPSRHARLPHGPCDVQLASGDHGSARCQPQSEGRSALQSCSERAVHTKKNSGNIYPYCAERDAYMLQTKQANLTKFSNSLKVTATKKVVLKDWSNKNRPQLKPQLQFPSSRRKTKLYAHLN